MRRPVIAPSLAAIAAAAGMPAAPVNAQEIQPLWVTRVPAGTSLSSGYQRGVLNRATGAVYMVGTAGDSIDRDAIVAGIDADGAELWTRTYNGPGDWYDQGRSIALGADGTVYACGNTPDPTKRAQALVLEYDGRTGQLLSDTIYRATPGASESAYELVVGDDGSVFFGGSTNGDGPDSMVVRLAPDKSEAWMTTWDGAAHSPYSQDHVDQMQMLDDGSLLVMHYGVMADLQPDYVLTKYDPADGSIIWDEHYGTRAGEYAREFLVDASGDIFVTGVGLGAGDKFFTIKVDGASGAELWQAYDGNGFDDHGSHLALDGEGGLYIAGDIDYDGDRSNANDQIYVVKRDAATGEFLWEFEFGATCRRCGSVPTDIALDAAGNLLLLGRTSAPPYDGHTILFRLDRDTGVELDRWTSLSVIPGAMHFDDAGDMVVTGNSQDPSTGEAALTAWKMAGLGACPADLDGDGSLTIFDFLAFGNLFDLMDPAADFDGDGEFTIFDFLAFQNAFDVGCE